MSDLRTAVLWVYGPPGVGKTTVAWQVYSVLVRSGLEVGYVDIDQLGMCYPERASDPGRFRLAAENLGAVVAGYAAAGARAVVVSGVVDPVHAVYVDKLREIRLTTCRLRADLDELSRRLVARQGDQAPVAEALANAEALDARDFGDLCIDTTGLSPDDVVRRVLEGTAGWDVPAGPPEGAGTQDVSGPQEAAEAQPTAEPVDGPILWLCGPTGVGKSAAGFDLYLRHVLGNEIPGAFVDLDQIGFYPPARTGPRPAHPMTTADPVKIDHRLTIDHPRTIDHPMRVDHRMRARILADLWRTFREAGARCLVVVGPAEDDSAITIHAEALPAATITVGRLHAGRDELARRIKLRGQGVGWAQPGDPLVGQPVEYLSSAIDQAVADAVSLERAAVGDVRIDTDGRTVKEVADAIVAATGFPQ